MAPFLIIIIPWREREREREMRERIIIITNNLLYDLDV
jgi:hypothetical protein